MQSDCIIKVTEIISIRHVSIFSVLVALTILSGCVTNAANQPIGKLAYLAHTNGYWQVWLMCADGVGKKQVTITDNDKTHISWYPDGEYLLVNNSDGRLEKVNVVTRDSIPILLPIKGTVDAVLSPDGANIAFSLSVAGSIDNNHIWLVNSNGDELRKVTNLGGLQHEPVWSQDNQSIYFLSSGEGGQSHDIWRVAINGSKAIEQITSGSLFSFDVAISGNGSLAYSNNRTGNYEIWIRDTNNNEKQLTMNEAIDSRPTWSSDEQEVIFESARSGVMNIWKINLNDGNLQQLTNEIIGARYPVLWH